MNLRSLRKSAGYSLERLCQISGVRRQTISELERGEIASPHYKTVRDLALALELPVAEVAAAIEASRS